MDPNDWWQQRLTEAFFGPAEAGLLPVFGFPTRRQQAMPEHAQEIPLHLTGSDG